MINSSLVVFSEGGNATVIVTTYAKVMERIYVRVTRAEFNRFSHLAEDHGKIHMDAGMLQLHNPLVSKTHI